MATSEGSTNNTEAPAPEETLTPGSRLAAQKAAKAARKAAGKGTAPLVPGAVGERISGVNEWFEGNRRTILGSVATVVLFAVVAIAWNLYDSSTARSAGSALKGALEVVSAAKQAEEQALTGEPLEGAVPEPVDTAKALEKFRQVVASYPRSEAAKWAKLGEAKQLFDSGKYDEAIKAYTDASRLAYDAPFLKARSLEGLGFSLEAQEKYQEAAERFKEMASAGGEAYKALANYHMARMYMAQGDKKRAAAKLNEVVSSLQEKASGNDQSQSRFVMFEASARLRELGVTPRKPKASGSRSSQKARPAKSSQGSRKAAGDGKQPPPPRPVEESEQE